MGLLFLRYLGTGIITWIIHRKYYIDSPLIVSLCMLYASAELCLIGVLVYFNVGCSILGKDKRSGMIPIWSYIIHWPFHLFNGGFKALKQSFRAFPHVSKANSNPDLFIGDIHAPKQQQQYQDGARNNQRDLDMNNLVAIVDVTSEFPKQNFNLNVSYLNIPVWDGNPPSIEDIDLATNFVKTQIETRKGQVLVHCASGIGRSALILVACFIDLELADSVDEAYNKIKASRNIVKLNKIMRKRLDEWFELRKTKH